MLASSPSPMGESWMRGGVSAPALLLLLLLLVGAAWAPSLRCVKTVTVRVDSTVHRTWLWALAEASKSAVARIPWPSIFGKLPYTTAKAKRSDQRRADERNVNLGRVPFLMSECPREQSSGPGLYHPLIREQTMSILRRPFSFGMFSVKAAGGVRQEWASTLECSPPAVHPAREFGSRLQSMGSSG